MGTVVLVRHGQASSLAKGDYDQLSELGTQQARMLGDFWAERGERFEKVFVGPRKRHVQTHHEVAQAYRERGLILPDPTPCTELDEHHAQFVLAQNLPKLAEKDAEVRSVVEALMKGDPAASKRYLEVFRRMARAYATGEVGAEGYETFRQFRLRVEKGMQAIVGGAAKGARRVAFTSGGFTAAAVGLALGVDDARTMDLSLSIKNGSLTELLFSTRAEGGALMLGTFNTTPHLREDVLTLV